MRANWTITIIHTRRELLGALSTGDLGKISNYVEASFSQPQPQTERTRVGAANLDICIGKKILQLALKEAITHGGVFYELQAQLALGEIEMNSKQLATGRVRLLAVQKVAMAKGFLFIASKARDGR